MGSTSMVNVSVMAKKKTNTHVRKAQAHCTLPFTFAHNMPLSFHKRERTHMSPSHPSHPSHLIRTMHTAVSAPPRRHTRCGSSRFRLGARARRAKAYPVSPPTTSRCTRPNGLEGMPTRGACGDRGRGPARIDDIIALILRNWEP